MQKPSVADAKLPTIFYILLILLCLSFFLILLPRLAEGTLWHTDEAYTAQRSGEMLLSGDYGSVHLYFKPNFDKPPLQYYLTTLSMRFIHDRELAVRIWSLLYALACLALVPWIYLRLAPGRWMEALAAAAFTATYPHFVDNARLGLLDMGLTFFLLLMLLASLRAVSSPPLWILGGLAAGLGTWQKNALPLIALVSTLILYICFHHHTFSLRKKWLLSSISTAFLVALAWPVWQMLHYPQEYVQSFHQNLKHLTTPDIYIDPDDYWLYLKFLFSQWNLFALVALLSVAAPLWSKKLRRLLPYMQLVSIIVVYLILISLCAFKRNYYLVPMIPLLAIVGVYFLSVYLRKRPFFFSGLCILLLCGTVAFSRGHFTRPSKDYTLQVFAIQDAVRTSNPHETLCFIYTPKHFESIESLFPAFVLYYSQLQRPIDIYSLPSFRKLPALTRVRGVIHNSSLPAIQPLMKDIHILASYGDYLLFYGQRTSAAPNTLHGMD